MGLDDITPIAAKKQACLNLTPFFNANVDDIFRNEYLSPRSPYTTLQIPTQGVGEWCKPAETFEIEDNGFRSLIHNGMFDSESGICFASPKDGHNIVYTSLWDNYPDSVTIKIDISNKTRFAKEAILLLAGSTNNMQSRIDNGLVIANYTDGSSDTLHLENPINWCPIEQDYYYDDYAFRSASKHPYRLNLSDGKIHRDGAKDSDTVIPCGAAQILKMELNPKKNLKSFTLKTLSNDVVIGIIAITLTK